MPPVDLVAGRSRAIPSTGPELDITKLCTTHGDRISQIEPGACWPQDVQGPPTRARSESSSGVDVDGAACIASADNASPTIAEASVATCSPASRVPALRAALRALDPVCARRGPVLVDGRRALRGVSGRWGCLAGRRRCCRRRRCHGAARSSPRSAAAHRSDAVGCRAQIASRAPLRRRRRARTLDAIEHGATLWPDDEAPRCWRCVCWRAWMFSRRESRKCSDLAARLWATPAREARRGSAPNRHLRLGACVRGCGRNRRRR